MKTITYVNNFIVYLDYIGKCVSIMARLQM